MKRIIVLITLMAIALCLWTACAGEETKLVGEPFPEFAFTDADGTAYTAAGLLEGKKLLVLHVFAAWDTNGTPQLPMMEDVYRRHQDQMAFAASPMVSVSNARSRCIPRAWIPSRSSAAVMSVGRSFTICAAFRARRPRSRKPTVADDVLQAEKDCVSSLFHFSPSGTGRRSA